MSNGKLGYYVIITGKLPRKRKIQRFETRVESMNLLDARLAAINLIEKHKIKVTGNAYVQPWNISETNFMDHNGKEQTIVMRAIFPSGPGQEINL